LKNDERNASHHCSFFIHQSSIRLSMSPLLFLGLTLLITASAVTFDFLTRRRRRHELQALATELKMAYSPRDRFALADRVAEHFPIPGAAALRVIDLLYSSDASHYRYLFSAEFTLGVIRSKSRMIRAVTLREPKGRSDPAIWANMLLAPADLPLIEQYRHLAKQISAAELSRAD
jgi:hypothetical protein